MKYYEGLLLGLVLIAQLGIELNVLASPLDAIQKIPPRDAQPILDISYNISTTSPTVELELDHQSCPDGYECAPASNCTSLLVTEGISGNFSSKVSKICPGTIDVCCYTQKSSQNDTPATDTRASVKESCGKRNMDGIGSRIQNSGEQAEFGEFPWMVTVLLKNYTDDDEEVNVYQGGGSLIHPSVVLTAAHRVHGLPTNSLRIRAGVWDTSKKNALFPHQDRDIAQVVVHDSYDPATLRYDVALVFLAAPVQLTDHIQPICLPPSDYDSDYRRCITTGFGKDSFTINATYTNILKKVNVPIVPSSDCESLLKSTRLGKYFELHDSFICAGGEEGKDSCNGDGGSPLICSARRNQYYQVGIVAWGIGCGDNNIPAVYSNVAKFRGWIDKIVQQRGLTIDSYTPGIETDL